MYYFVVGVLDVVVNFDVVIVVVMRVCYSSFTNEFILPFQYVNMLDTHFCKKSEQKKTLKETNT